jgi:hypothetical protein
MRRHARVLWLSWLTLTLLASQHAPAAQPERSIASERPDPASVQRFGPAYRYPRAGWIVVHVEGSPYERGYQHGRLLAAEIADYVKTLATKRSIKGPGEAWRETRTMVNALFLRRYDPEYLEEMKGIADGASAAVAKFEGRPIDLLDVVTVNSDIELEFLDSALDATATGLEPRVFREPPDQTRTTAPPEHCSAFAATGPATADGKIVFGHITMFSLYSVRHFNVWLDVKPAKGHRLLMQTYPGGIQSGMDYYMNDAGLLVCETTITQTKFDINGQALASRIRTALQYSDSIDQAVATLKSSNNGMYTNEWLLGDTKTNEIAMFELGTHKSKLWRSSSGEWFGGTKGFYWGCNNTKDLEVRLETVPSMEGRPANVVFHPADRDRLWLRLFEKHKGKIDAAFGFEAFTTPPLAAFSSCDAKFTTSDMAKELKTWALFGPPLGKTWDPSETERKRFPDIQPLVSNDWTILSADPPASSRIEVAAAKDERARLGREEIQRQIDALDEMKLERTRDVERLSDQIESLAAARVRLEDGRSALERERIPLDRYRELHEELFSVETLRTGTKARLEQLVGRKTAPDEEEIKRLVDNQVQQDAAFKDLQAEIARAKEHETRIRRLVRTTADPALVHTSKTLAQLIERQNDLRKALEPAIRRKLVESGPDQLTLQVIDETRANLAELADREKALLSRLRPAEPKGSEVANTLKTELTRQDLERARDALEKINRQTDQLRVDAHKLAPEPPKEPAKSSATPADLPKPGESAEKSEDDEEHEHEAPHPAAWHGTLLPKTDADTWLAAAFADYERIVAREKAYKAKAKAKKRELNDEEKDELAVALFAPYSQYKAAVARLGQDVPLSQTQAELNSEDWYHIAAGKGVLFLATLREKAGDEPFFKFMDEFGRAHAGKAVSTSEFCQAAGKVKGVDQAFLDKWLHEKGLPNQEKGLDGTLARPFWSINSYEAELDKSVIVYGTIKESDAQREAGERLQRQIQRKWSNVAVKLLADRDATLEAVKGRHVLLVGRPDTNSVAADLAKHLPLVFGPESFVLRGKTYANAHTAVIAAGPNPGDPDKSVVIFAGLSADATWHCVQTVGERDGEPAEALLLAAGAKPRRLVVGETKGGQLRAVTR